MLGEDIKRADNYRSLTNPADAYSIAQTNDAAHPSTGPIVDNNFFWRRGRGVSQLTAAYDTTPTVANTQNRASIGKRLSVGIPRAFTCLALSFRRAADFLSSSAS